MGAVCHLGPGRRTPVPATESADVDDGLYLEDGAKGKRGHGHARPGRAAVTEGLAIDLVHRREVAHLGQEHRGLDHLVQSGSVGLHLGPQVGQRLGGLGLETALSETAGDGTVDGAAIDDADLTGDEQQVAGADDRGVGTDSLAN